MKLDNQDVRLLLYDTAGQEKFRSLIPMYIRDANIIIVVYDITSTNILYNFYYLLDKESFNRTINWLNEVKDLKRADAIFAIVGNKLDLNEKRVVPFSEAEALAKERQMICHEVSAKTGENINTLFYKDIFDQIIANFKSAVVEDDNGVDGNGIKLDGESKKVNKKSGCC